MSAVMGATQRAPFPHELDDLVRRLRYRPMFFAIADDVDEREDAAGDGLAEQAGDAAGCHERKMRTGARGREMAP